MQADRAYSNWPRQTSGPPPAIHMTHVLQQAKQEGSPRGRPLCCPTRLISGLTASHLTQVPLLCSTQPIWPGGSLVAHNRSTIPYFILSILSPPPSFTNMLYSTSTTNQSNTSICEHKQSAPFRFPSDPLRLVTLGQRENIISLFPDYFRKGMENLSDNQFMCLRTITSLPDFQT